VKLLLPLALGCLLAYEAHQSGWPHPDRWLAAQIQVESAWDPDAQSRYASGLAQFTPGTWSDWSGRTDPGCAGETPYDPPCAIRTQIVYMEWLMRKWPPSHNAWRAYNGGGGWISKERRLCAASPGCDPRNPLHLERFCRAAGRHASACRENIAYPRKIERLL